MDMQKERELLKKHTYPDDDLLDRDDLSVCEKWFLMGYREAAKASAVPDGYVLVRDRPVAYMVQNKFWKGEFEVKLLNEMPEPEFEGDSYDVEIPLYMIEAAQEQGHE